MSEIIESLEQLHMALSALSDALVDAGACEEGVFNSKLVVSELIGNALKHAVEKKAFFDYRLCGETCVLKIKSVPSFQPPDESVCSDVLSESGRGLFLVQQCSEACVVEKDGSVCVSVRIK